MSTTSVTSIVNNLSRPIEIYFKSLIEDSNFQQWQKHDPYGYPRKVESRQLWAEIGIFYDYLIRKEVNYILQREATDRRAQACFNRLHRKITGLSAYFSLNFVASYDEEQNVTSACYQIDNSLQSVLTDEFLYLLSAVKSYMVYKHVSNPTQEIIEHIFNTAMLHFMHFRDNNTLPIDFSKSLINEDNIEDTLRYVRSLDLSDVILNPIANCQFFQGDGDLLLNDCLMEIKVSKYHYESKYIKRDSRLMTAIYQMILYGFGFFLREGRVVKKFKIYNPLLGVEYILDIPNLDYNYLLQMVQMEGIVAAT